MKKQKPSIAYRWFFCAKNIVKKRARNKMFYVKHFCFHCNSRSVFSFFNPNKSHAMATTVKSAPMKERTC